MSIKQRIENIENPKIAPRLYSIAALVAIIVLSGIWLVGQFTKQDLERDLQNWREKLNLIAESRSEEVHEWVDGKFGELRSLADNPSLQLYLTQLQTTPDDTGTLSNVDAAQKSYLRNLVLFTADRAGFKSESLKNVKANIEPAGNSGLAIFDKHNQFIVSTAMTAPTRDMLARQVKAAPDGKENLIDIQRTKGGDTIIGFIVPVYSIQGERNAASQIGKVAGVILLDKQLTGLLKHPATTEKTLETILTRKAGNQIEFLSPLLDGSKTLGKRINFELRKFAEAGLIQTTGNFLTRKRDYRNKPVLATSRRISGTDWTLIVKIDRKEALVKSNQQRAGMVAFFFMLIAVIVLLIIAIWWYAHSKRSMLMSHHFKRLAAQAIAQEELLALVSNNQPESIYIIDEAHIYRYGNERAASNVDTSSKHLAGKNIFDVQGPIRGEWIAEHCDKALAENSTQYNTTEVLRGGKEHIIRHAFVPLKNIPIHSLPEATRGILIIEQDITKVMKERERRIETQRQLVQTLIKLVDKRDPFAANHSTLVSMIAKEVAIELELTAEMVETTYTAGSLMNIGKMTVPKKLLTKEQSLTDEEKKIVHESMKVAVDVIQDVNFDGPVADTLRQWQEKWDGTGPLQMSGENVLISARIIAVANAFIGMISPRSWRNAMPVEKASDFLMNNADTLFDRKVVAALINHIENHKGRNWIEESITNKRDDNKA